MTVLYIDHQELLIAIFVILVSKNSIITVRGLAYALEKEIIDYT
jgi:hypothetical protein